jgi:hypothetical protein
MYLSFLNSVYRLLGDTSNGRESGYAAGSVCPVKPNKKAGGVATAGFSCWQYQLLTP